MGDIKGLVSGHTQTAKSKRSGEESVQFWRFMRRDNVEAGVPIAEWPGYPAQPSDVVLMVKFYASSPNTCGMLKVFLPAVELAKLPPMPTKMSARDAFFDRHRNEFRKLAQFVKQAPWHLDSAAAYVDELVANH